MSTNEPEGAGIDATRYVRDLVTAGSLSQAIGAAIELGVFDAIAEGAGDVAALSRATDCSRDGVERLVRVLVAAGLLTRRENGGALACTALGQALVRGGTNGAPGLAVWWSHYRWPAWAHLAGSVRTGCSARSATRVVTGFDRLGADAAAAAIFNEAMTGVTQTVAADVAARLDLSGAQSVIDVGGGYGVLIAALLAANPGLRATLLDLSHALDGATANLRARGLLERCTLVAGDFFDAVPAGADACLLMRVLHDWSDADCRRILAACRKAIDAAGVLCVVERLLPETIECSPEHVEVALSDLNMLVMLGGRERTQAHLAALLREARFAVSRVTPLALGFSLVEARA